ncbi:MAG: ATP-binding cassette domain-containing protein [Lachnospiraceae bacterium]|nr:ATP-binding cassette domain-containing protein [Lachnospiraceae bacterium]
MIELKNISKSFDGKKVLDSFNCVFEQGGYLLKGPSGIGKTTCIMLILGLMKPDEGEVILPGETRFAVCFQENRLFEKETVLTNITAVNENVTEADAKKAFLELLPADALDKKAGELSGGMKRRLAVIRAMLHDSDVVILDEPFTGLDDEARTATIAFINRHLNGRLLIITSHDERGLDGLRAVSIDPVET